MSLESWLIERGIEQVRSLPPEQLRQELLKIEPTLTQEQFAVFVAVALEGMRRRGMIDGTE